MIKTLRTLFVCLASALALVAYTHAQITPPQGRLTLDYQHPVMITDVPAANFIYYTYYVGDSIPIYNGTSWSSHTFSSYLTLQLSSTYQTIGNLYDVYVFVDSSGDLSIGVTSNPWYSTTLGRQPGGGSPSYCSNLGVQDGVWVANAGQQLNNGSLTYNVAAYTATYVGSVYIPTTAGETSMVFYPTAAAGGNANVLGLYNAYNRVRIIARSSDTSTAWTYTTATWRQTGGHSGNKISWLDGLQQSFVDARTQISGNASTSGGGPAVGVELDNLGVNGVVAVTNDTFQINLQAYDHYTPQMGLHTVYSEEYANIYAYFNPNGGSTQNLQVELDM